MRDNIIHMYPKDDIPVEVFEWYIRIQDGNLSPKDTRSLRLWIQENPELATCFSDLDDLWVAMDDASLNAPRSLSARAPRLFTRLSEVKLWKYTAAAAAILLISFVALPFIPTGPEIETRQFETLTGERHIALLPDGTSLHMNAQTRVSIRFGDKERLIELQEGEAYFAVAKDPERPFIVRSGDLRIRALGTIFNVEHMVDQTSAVTLVEGVIEVAEIRADESRSSALLTQKGDRATLIEVTALETRTAAHDRVPLNRGITLAQVNVENVISWREGKLIFSGETLAQAIRKLNIHSRHKVILQDPDIGNEPIYGVFSMGDWQSAVRAIVKSYPLEAVKQGTHETLLVSTKG